MNLSVASRLGMTGLISASLLTFLPLAWIGYHPLLILTGLALGLFYQIWIHTELIGKLGPLEWIFNTPSHHRVHHASNGQYLDKNYGGVLIIFDRMFGTFAAEEEKPVYGLTEPHGYRNPFKIAFYEWSNMIRDVRTARSIRDALGYMFSRPGWSPNAESKLMKDKSS